MIYLFFLYLPAILVLFVALSSRARYKFLLGTEKARADEILQRTLLLQQDLSSKEEELNYLKALLSMLMSRPAQALMSDQQITGLAQVLSTMIQANLKGHPGELN